MKVTKEERERAIATLKSELKDGTVIYVKKVDSYVPAGCNWSMRLYNLSLRGPSKTERSQFVYNSDGKYDTATITYYEETWLNLILFEAGVVKLHGRGNKRYNLVACNTIGTSGMLKKLEELVGVKLYLYGEVY